MDQNQMNELLLCPICLDRFMQPKVLPCQHTFCLRPCLEGLVENQRICCPECRAVHTLPPKGFPNNLTIVRLLDVPIQKKLSIEASCQECKKNNGLFGRCLHCEKLLCRKCLAIHLETVRAELKESVSKVSNRIPEVSQKIARFEQSQESVEKNEQMIKKKIEEWFHYGVSELQAKKKKLIADVREFARKEIGILDERQETLEMKLVVMKSFCENAERRSKRHTASDKVSHQQALLIEMLRQSKNLEAEDDKEINKKYAKFREKEGQSIIDSISKFQGIELLSKPMPSPREKETAPQQINVHRCMSSFTAVERIQPDMVAQSSSAVQEYRKKGREKKCFGKKGSEVGCLNLPWEIDVNAANELVIADKNNDRIQIFHSSDSSVQTFGCRGKEAGEFDDPWGVCVSILGQIIVADTFNHRIQILNDQGTFITEFSGNRLRYPYSVATNNDGFVFVADDSNSIKVFSSRGDFIRTFGESWLNSFGKAKYLTVTHDDKVLVSEKEKHRIGIFDRSWQLLFEIGTKGECLGQFKYPRGVACDKHGNIIVADSENHRVQVFDKDGHFITSFGSEGSQPGQMSCPSGVAVLRNGDIAVCDSGNHRIQIF